MHLLESICDFLQSYFCKHIIYAHETSRFHSSQPMPPHEQNRGEKPNRCYLFMKCEKCHSLNVRKGFGRVLTACAHVHANVTCSTFGINEMWWLKVAAPGFSISIPAASETGDH